MFPVQSRRKRNNCCSIFYFVIAGYHPPQASNAREGLMRMLKVL